MCRTAFVIVAALVVHAGPVRAQAVAVPADTSWDGSANLNVSAAQGTQSQSLLTVALAVAHNTGLTPSELQAQSRVRAEFSYGMAQKPGQDSITTSEMAYGEVRQSFDARQLMSAFGGRVSPRASASTDVWLYALASAYHHIAFGLDDEQAYGAGLACDVPLLSGLSVASDLRHIHERFVADYMFSGWAARLYESYTVSWILDPAEKRIVTLTESVELIPAFASSGALQGRTLVVLSLPVVRRLNVNFTGGLDYMRNTPSGYTPRYWKTTAGISYNFSPQ
jgi:hypothetical protein